MPRACVAAEHSSVHVSTNRIAVEQRLCSIGRQSTSASAQRHGNSLDGRALILRQSHSAAIRSSASANSMAKEPE